MLFNSYIFVLFFIAVFAIHSVALKWKYKKLNLLAASYLFYAAWNPLFLPLILFSTIVDWWMAKKIASTEIKKYKRYYLAGSVLVNLGLLSYFKYSQFFLDTAAEILGAAGLAYNSVDLDIILPLGISFYTFQTLSYSIDVYRGEIKPWHSFLDYALYVTFFPQLVAGPIVRAKYFLPQCLEEKKASARHKSWGLNLAILGLFQKVVLADGVFAPVSDKVFMLQDSQSVSGLDAMIGVLAFSGQIFCDFSGYSTIAIGLGLMLGFTLPDNFRFPYAAQGFSDFWQRWHISLSTWLRDYLYIPLGGSHLGTTKTIRNLVITMFLGGLWHGANWTFVIWGLLHGTYLVLEHALKLTFSKAKFVCSPYFGVVSSFLTFVLVSYAWIYFRAESLSDALVIHGALFDLDSYGEASMIKVADRVLVPLGIILIVIAHHFLKNRSLEELVEKANWMVHASVLASMLFLIMTSTTNSQSFIYFQF